MVTLICVHLLLNIASMVLTCCIDVIDVVMLKRINNTCGCIRKNVQKWEVKLDQSLPNNLNVGVAKHTVLKLLFGYIKEIKVI